MKRMDGEEGVGRGWERKERNEDGGMEECKVADKA